MIIPRCLISRSASSSLDLNTSSGCFAMLGVSVECVEHKVRVRVRVRVRVMG